MPKPIRLLILAPYPPKAAPSQRFRFEHYLPMLDGADIRWDYRPFLQERTWAILYRPGHKLQKIWGVSWSFILRWWLMLWIWRYDLVLIHREASPIGPPIFEWIIRFLWRKPFVYDFDDAIWLPNTTEQNRMVAGLKWHGKVRSICTWASQITVGNEYLRQYAAQFNDRAICLPTVVDTEQRHRGLQKQRSSKPALGWTGSHSTLSYLLPLLPLLQKLQKERDFDFYVICNEPAPAWDLPNLRFVPWKAETEIEDLLLFHIGLMPLVDDAWAAGKCGFKAIQYMALGIVPVVSPVGVNTQIVNNGKTGYWASSLAEWESILNQLLDQADLREKLGREAQAFIQAHYSVRATWPVFEATLRAALA